MKVNGFKIDVLVAEKGYRRADFAHKIGVVPQTLSKVIRDNSTTMFTAVKIAKGLEVNVAELMAEK